MIIIRRLSAAVAILLLAAGCATVPELAPDADPVGLLPHNTDLMVSFPLHAQRAGIETVLPELFDGDMAPLLNRTARIVAARTPAPASDTPPVLHAVIEGGFTASTLRFGLPRGQGWSRERVAGIRYYRNENLAVMLIEKNLLYAVITENPEVYLHAALLRVAHPSPDGHPLALPAVADAGRIIWLSSDVLLDGILSERIPQQLRHMLDVSGQFDYAVSLTGSVLMQGELLSSSESVARALNVTLRILLPQILETVDRPRIERRETSLLIDNIEIPPGVIREWFSPLLEDFR
ncbi:MAG: hypothetical protein ACOCVC_05560 [Spirochaeta sp.]